MQCALLILTSSTFRWHIVQCWIQCTGCSVGSPEQSARNGVNDARRDHRAVCRRGVRIAERGRAFRPAVRLLDQSHAQLLGGQFPEHDEIRRDGKDENGENSVHGLRDRCPSAVFYGGVRTTSPRLWTERAGCQSACWSASWTAGRSDTQGLKQQCTGS